MPVTCGQRANDACRWPAACDHGLPPCGLTEARPDLRARFIGSGNLPWRCTQGRRAGAHRVSLRSFIADQVPTGLCKHLASGTPCAQPARRSGRRGQGDRCSGPRRRPSAKRRSRWRSSGWPEQSSDCAGLEGPGRSAVVALHDLRSNRWQARHLIGLRMAHRFGHEPANLTKTVLAGANFGSAARRERFDAQARQAPRSSRSVNCN